MAEIDSVTQEEIFICINDMTISKSNMQEIADHIALNPTHIKWVSTGCQVVTIK